ncbi:hypothetical protein CHS0354_003150 [Potamilus streckersoni]|uniref:Transmembrane protein 128 n=1 Tax=Potamilus streckersoni TaxID=2493646 RepID=A0AAE0VL36_9BIVA|nr:hypothetical protein CHS0354_003150 [Potamilus streckersoni]
MTSFNGSVDSCNNNLHRRVQRHIASTYLKQIDPDGVYLEDEYKDKLQQFKELDPDKKEKFDKEHRKYRKIESPYSIQNILWLLASMATFYYSDFYLAVTYDPRVNRLLFKIGMLLMGVNISIAVFLIIWLSYVKKIDSDKWEKSYPAAIPIATASFVLGAVVLTVALWPVWGILTPVILFILFMGFIVFIAMLPNF